MLELNLELQCNNTVRYYQHTNNICRYLFNRITSNFVITAHCLLASHRSDNSVIGYIYISTPNSQRHSLKTTRLNMIESFPVHPAATSSTRGRLKRIAVALALAFVFICAVFLSTHRILASAPTSFRTDEHHKVKVWYLNSSHFEAYKLEYAPISCFKQLKNVLIICP